MNTRIVLALISFVLLSGCKKTEYAASDVSIKAEGYTADGIELRFVTPQESLYYCPGLDLSYEDEKVQFSYVRAHKDHNPEVDVAADNRDGESRVTIPFRSGKDRIELIDPTGKSLGAWQITPTKQVEKANKSEEPTPNPPSD